MRAAELVTAAVLMAGALLVVWDALQLGTGWGSDGPKSGFFPFSLAALVLLACLGIVRQALRRIARPAFVTPDQLRPVLQMFLPAVGYAALMPWTGLYVASALYLGGYMRWLGGYRWRVAASVALGFAAAAFVVFETWFLVPMPKGPIEAWLGY
jgi:putative tricarboxylic transport membrane protein